MDVGLIGFCDASEKGYSAVVYFRVKYAGENENVRTNFIAAKTRIAPVKKQSIPRLELLGAVILARLMNRVEKIFDGLTKFLCLTDSVVTLYWIQNVTKTYKQYVESDFAKAKRTPRNEFLITSSGLYFL